MTGERFILILLHFRKFDYFALGVKKTLSYSITAVCYIPSLARSVQIKYEHSTNATSRRRMNHKDRRRKTSRDTLLNCKKKTQWIRKDFSTCMNYFVYFSPCSDNCNTINFTLNPLRESAFTGPVHRLTNMRLYPTINSCGIVLLWGTKSM